MKQAPVKPIYDLFVVGGGINGTGIARDAAGRDLSVYLCEKGDLAQGTSSASTKLIHGGLRYLEFYEFRLVREALHEREILLKSAPNIIWPMEFVMPHSPALRSMWLLRLGLFLYDHLARRRRLNHSYKVDLRQSRFGKPLKRFVREGFVYSDCWVEDSRLVISTALDAANHGASINTYAQFMRAEKTEHLWRITVRHDTGAEEEIYARYLVNAAGAGVDKIAERIHGIDAAPQPLRLVKGSHIVVPRLYDGEHAYILQHSDRRMVFVIPFEDKYTLIGTTDQPADEDDVKTPKISSDEIDYLLEAVNVYFTKGLSKDDIVYTYSGIRPLFDDGSTEARRVTRDYVIRMQDGCVTVFGGKITTFRRLAEEVVDGIVADDRQLGAEHKPWTARSVLPGGNLPGTVAEYSQYLLAVYPFLPEELAMRWATQFGSRTHQFLRDVTSMDQLGTHFGKHLYAREVEYLIRHEWARDADDILLRRTRLGMDNATTLRAALTAYLAARQRED